MPSVPEDFPSLPGAGAQKGQDGPGRELSDWSSDGHTPRLPLPRMPAPEIEPEHFPIRQLGNIVTREEGQRSRLTLVKTDKRAFNDTWLGLAVS